MPRDSLDAPEDLSKQALRRVVFGQLEDTVLCMSDEAPAIPRRWCPPESSWRSSMSSPAEGLLRL